MFLRVNLCLRSLCLTMLGLLASTGCIHSASKAMPEERRPSGGVVTQPRYDASGAYIPRMMDLIGANGVPGDFGGQDLWRKMGLRFSRIEVNPVEGADLQDMVNRGWINEPEKIDGLVNYNNLSGVDTLLLIAYTPGYNATVRGEGHSAPMDGNEWNGFVEAVVKRYSAAPYNVKYFQIWNEAAGRIATAVQSPFWKGPADGNGVYAYAREDYVNKIHIPAAQIIRRFKCGDGPCRVVYGGWPCESSPSDYISWLEYRSPSHEYNNMLDWIDYLDMHYYNVADLKQIYEHVISNTTYSNYGQIKGIWQSEIGDGYFKDNNYLANYYFQFAQFALDHKWDHPDKFVSLIYHYWGPEEFRLTFNGAMKMAGTGLMTMINNTNGKLSKFDHPIEYGAGISGQALQADNNAVLLVIGNNGTRTITIQNYPAPRGYNVYYKDALNDADLGSHIISKSWEGTTLKITLDVPMGAEDQNKVYREKMGFLVVVPNY